MKVGDTYTLKGVEWTVAALDGENVTVKNPVGRALTVPASRLDGLKPTAGKVQPTPVEEPAALITVQDYLLSIGLDHDRLQTLGMKFGRAVAQLYRKRTGLEPLIKREFVHYLDREYDSKAYADTVLLDEVRERLLPNHKVMDLDEAVAELEKVFQVSVPKDTPPVWLAEKQVQECARRGWACRHETCQRRRPRQKGWEPDPGSGDMFDDIA